MPLDAAHGMPSHWMGYLECGDVDETSRRVEALGGKVCTPAMDIPNVGRFSIVSDPHGAFFSPFASKTPEQYDAAPEPGLGHVGWSELMTSDDEGAKAFYGELLGWSAEGMDLGDMGVYHLVSQGGSANFAGIMKTPAGANMPTAWLYYINVVDADATAARVADLGGALVVEPMTIPGGGRIAVFTDSTGAAMGVLSPPVQI